MCPSKTSAINELNAPRHAEIVCRISEQSASRSIACSMDSTCPRMRRTRLSIFFLSRSMWARSHLRNYSNSIPHLVYKIGKSFCKSMASIFHSVTTQRLVIGQVSVCIGCCCGQTDRGKPVVPVEWLKSEWRRRGLLKNIQLTISGCLCPCDVPNVVLIITPQENIWLGIVDGFEYSREIVEWAGVQKGRGPSAAARYRTAPAPIRPV